MCRFVIFVATNLPCSNSPLWYFALYILERKKLFSRFFALKHKFPRTQLSVQQNHWHGLLLRYFQLIKNHANVLWTFWARNLVTLVTWCIWHNVTQLCFSSQSAWELCLVLFGHRVVFQYFICIFVKTPSGSLHETAFATKNENFPRIFQARYVETILPFWRHLLL